MGASVTIITLLYTLAALVLAVGLPHGIGSSPLLIGIPPLLALVLLYLRYFLSGNRLFKTLVVESTPINGWQSVMCSGLGT